MSGNRRHKRVTITVDEGKGTVVKRIALLTDSLLRVVRGSKLVEVEDADYIHGRLIIILEGQAHCEDVIAGIVHVEVEPLP